MTLSHMRDKLQQRKTRREETRQTLHGAALVPESVINFIYFFIVVVIIYVVGYYLFHPSSYKGLINIILI